MKICEYCNSVCEDGASVCPSCAGNSFIHICNNCGNRFKDAFCPNCGVRAGTAAKVCPRCSGKYFSAACPNCGYMPGAQNGSQPCQQTYQYQQTSAPAKKRSHLALWILGFIFCFPIPVTILIARSKLPKLVKTVLIALLWIIVVFIGRNG